MLAGWGAQQRLRPRQGNVGVAGLRLRLFQRCLRLVHRRLVRRLLNHVEQLAFGHGVAIGEILLLQIAGDTGIQLHNLRRLDAPDIGLFIVNRLNAGGDIAHFRWRGAHRL